MDNKPPLWLAQQVLGVATGHYVAVELLLMAVANIVIAVGIWRLGSELKSEQVGRFSALLYVLTIPVVNLTRINEATMGVALLILALNLRSSYRIGAVTGAAVLTSPWAIFGVPAIVVNRIYGDRIAFARFAVAGMAVGFLSVAVLWVGWGLESAIGAVRWSIGLGDAYWTGGNGSLLRRSIFYSPGGWAVINAHFARQYAVVLIPAAVGAMVTPISEKRLWILCMLAAPLLFKPHWEFVFPVACIFGALGWRHLTSGDDVI